MEFFHRLRLQKGCLAALLTMLGAALAAAQPLPAAAGGGPWILIPTRNESSLPLLPFSGAKGNRWATSFAAAANAGLIEVGTGAAVAAVLECQRGDYPGGGLGLLSMPFGRSSSRTDHCFR